MQKVVYDCRAGGHDQVVCGLTRRSALLCSVEHGGSEAMTGAKDGGSKGVWGSVVRGCMRII